MILSSGTNADAVPDPADQAIAVQITNVMKALQIRLPHIIAPLGSTRIDYTTVDTLILQIRCFHHFAAVDLFVKKSDI
jgi:hypothetical protein